MIKFLISILKIPVAFGKWIWSLLMRLDFGDRVAIFLALIAISSVMINLRLKAKNAALGDELKMHQQFVIDLQRLTGDLNNELRSTSAKFDSSNQRGVELQADVEFWGERVKGLQGVIWDQRREADSLRNARVKYIDRCYNCFGKLVKCK